MMERPHKTSAISSVLDAWLFQLDSILDHQYSSGFMTLAKTRGTVLRAGGQSVHLEASVPDSSLLFALQPDSTLISSCLKVFMNT
jgi:hypothetical protein